MNDRKILGQNPIPMDHHKFPPQKEMVPEEEISHYHCLVLRKVQEEDEG